MKVKCLVEMMVAFASRVPMANEGVLDIARISSSSQAILINVATNKNLPCFSKTKTSSMMCMHFMVLKPST